MTTLLQRIEDKIFYSPNGCWIWIGSIDSCSYARINVNGVNQKVSRVIYELHYGVEPSEKHVLHICDNAMCVNPYHLRLGTHVENMKDMSLKGRSTHGIKHAQAKFTETDIRIIREARNVGFSIVGIAKYFNRHKVLVDRIIRRKVWARV